MDYKVGSIYKSRYSDISIKLVKVAPGSSTHQRGLFHFPDGDRKWKTLNISFDRAWSEHRDKGEVCTSNKVDLTNALRLLMDHCTSLESFNKCETCIIAKECQGSIKISIRGGLYV